MPSSDRRSELIVDPKIEEKCEHNQESLPQPLFDEIFVRDPFQPTVIVFRAGDKMAIEYCQMQSLDMHSEVLAKWRPMGIDLQNIGVSYDPYHADGARIKLRLPSFWVPVNASEACERHRHEDIYLASPRERDIGRTLLESLSTIMCKTADVKGRSPSRKWLFLHRFPGQSKIEPQVMVLDNQ